VDGIEQISQPLPGILEFREAGSGVLPNVKEFLIILYGFTYLALSRTNEYSPKKC